MQLDIFGLLEETERKTPLESCMEWHRRRFKTYPPECEEFTRKLFEIEETAGKSFDAYERSKVLDNVLTFHLCGVCDLERLGAFDEAINYHQVWDRSHALKKGYTLDQVETMSGWDYSNNRPIY